MTGFLNRATRPRGRQVYKIPDALENKYQGVGHVLAAVFERQIIDIRYFRDILPDFAPDSFPSFLTDDRLAPTIRELSVLGEISVGMCGEWEFAEL